MWRLLAASAIGTDVTEQARRLADTFASRKPPDGRRQASASAADALEASIAATNPKDTKGGTYRKFREDLRDNKIKDRGMAQAWPAHILVLLNRARDRAPITHGTATTADAVIVEAAAALGGLGKAGQAGGLLHRHRQLHGEVSGCIRSRTQPTR
ncbi:MULTISPECIES: hypothetical protein [unclassified Micromonospora]|uniref:hypothetical protein n=1 Tax=unclassified Micromonospora TaxID=2617518 RepID=UPI003A89BD41